MCSRSTQLGAAILGTALSTWSCSHHRTWADGCRIHQPCEAVRSLPRCPPEWAASRLRDSVSESEGGQVVSGKLGFPDAFITQVGCESSSRWQRICCNDFSKPAVLIAEDGTYFGLTGLGCFGDESGSCCNVDASGQKVIARGVVDKGPGEWAYPSFREGVEICAL
jgi:hypothetical protein